MFCRGVAAAVVIALAAACSEESRPSFRLPTTPSTIGNPPPPPAPAPPSVPPSTDLRYVPGTGEPVRIGESLTFSIESSHPGCYPNWDQSGRCRLFEVTPADSGTLAVDVRRVVPSGADVVDLFVLAENGGSVLAYDGKDGEQTSLPVVAGRRYGIFVLSYPPFPQEFTLRVDLR